MILEKMLYFLFGILCTLLFALFVKEYNSYNNKQACNQLASGEVKEFCISLTNKNCLDLPDREQRHICSQWRN